MQNMRLNDPKLLRIAINRIVIPPGQSESTDGRAELSNALGAADCPSLIQPPLVEELKDGTYRLITGGRRVRAADASGWTDILCLVYRDVDPVDAQMLRVIENLTFTPLSLLDESIAIRLAFLAVNAAAMGQGEDARQILVERGSTSDSLVALENLLASCGFQPGSPAVSWNDVLTRIGFPADKGRRKRFLAIAGLRADLLPLIATLGLNETKLRALGGLGGDAQEELVEALRSAPEIGKLLVRIAKRVSEGESVSAAIREAQQSGKKDGQDAPDDSFSMDGDEDEFGISDDGAEIGGSEDSEGGMGVGGRRGDFIGADDGDDLYTDEEEDVPDEVVQKSVAELVESAHSFEKSLKTLRASLGQDGIMALPEPWGKYVAQSLERVQKSVRGSI